MLMLTLYKGKDHPNITPIPTSIDRSLSDQRPLKRMSLGVPTIKSVSNNRQPPWIARKNLQNVFIQANKRGLGENKIKILQRLRQPEAFHVVQLRRVLIPHVGDRRMRVFSSRDLLYVPEHSPGGVLEALVAGYSVHDEDGFDCFGPMGWLGLGLRRCGGVSELLHTSSSTSNQRYQLSPGEGGGS